MKTKAEILKNKIDLLESLLSKEELRSEEVSTHLLRIRENLSKLFN
jgi:chorismate mutase